MSFLDLTHEDDRDRNLEEIRRQAEGKIAVFQMDKRYVRKGGGQVWGRVSVSLIRDEFGHPDCTIAVLTDMTTHYEAEQKLRQSERDLRLITDSLPVLIAYCDRDAHYRFVNREYEAWTGISRDEIVGKGIGEMLGSENYSKLAPHVDAVLKGEVRQFEAEIEYRVAGPKTVSCSYLPHLDESGTLLGFFVLVTDVSARRQQEALLRAAKEAAEETSRAKSAFLATMSHELHTPLNAIIGFSTMIRDEVMGPLGATCYRDYAHDIHQSGQQLLALVNGMLELARIEAGKSTRNVQAVELNALLRLVYEAHASTASKAGLEMVCYYCDTPVVVDVDPEHVRQAMANVLSNAIKFTPEGGKVTLSVSVERDMAVIAVRDTGIGIAEGDIDKAMAPFGQVENRFARRYTGAGIGLPLSKALVQAQRGKFKIDSRVGAGTTISFEFPLSSHDLAVR